MNVGASFPSDFMTILLAVRLTVMCKAGNLLLDPMGAWLCVRPAGLRARCLNRDGIAVRLRRVKYLAGQEWLTADEK